MKVSPFHHIFIYMQLYVILTYYIAVINLGCNSFFDTNRHGKMIDIKNFKRKQVFDMNGSETSYLGNYDRPTNRLTDGLIGNFHFQ